MWISYIVLKALIISKTVFVWKENNWSGGYMIYIGIDMAKNKFDYCIINSELNVLESGIEKNNRNGFNNFLGIINKYNNTKMGVEATNIYHVNLCNFLLENSYTPLILSSIETLVIIPIRIFHIIKRSNILVRLYKMRCRYAQVL
jgi:hypothetical protein